MPLRGGSDILPAVIRADFRNSNIFTASWNKSHRSGGEEHLRNREECEQKEQKHKKAWYVKHWEDLKHLMKHRSEYKMYHMGGMAEEEGKVGAQLLNP